MRVKQILYFKNNIAQSSNVYAPLSQWLRLMSALRLWICVIDLLLVVAPIYGVGRVSVFNHCFLCST